MNPPFDPALLSRVEDAGINASASPQQRWLDGWLVRYSPGKAKRARCIQAVAPGRLGIPERLALCRPIYEASALSLYVRVTPFSEPELLDEELARLGMTRQDDTRVMVCSAVQASASLPRGFRFEQPGHHTFAELVGGLRGSTLTECRARAERLAQSPVPIQGFSLVDAEGLVVACGQIAVEAELVDLYDIFTAPAHRGRGLARVVRADAGVRPKPRCTRSLPAGRERQRRGKAHLPWPRLRRRLSIPLPDAGRVRLKRGSRRRPV